MKILGESFPDGDTYIAVCSNCGLVFDDSSASQKDYLNYYTSDNCRAPLYKDMFGEEATNKYYEHIYNVISQYIGKESAILDVAGSWGELGEYLIKKGYCDVTNLDPNKKCIEASKSRGIKTICADSTNMDNAVKRRYDLIIMNHMVEHVLNIKQLYENVIQLLTDEGTIFLEVPDAEAYCDGNETPYGYFTYEHVVHLSQNDLTNLAGMFGLDIIYMEKYYKKISDYPSIVVVMKKSSENKERTINYSYGSEDSVKKYINKSNKMVQDKLELYRQSQKPLILWGIGASTALYLESFIGCNVKLLVDGNPKRQGLDYYIGDKKYEIKSPQDIDNNDEVIFILSTPYRKSIEDQVKCMHLPNEVDGF